MRLNKLKAMFILSKVFASTAKTNIDKRFKNSIKKTMNNSIISKQAKNINEAENEKVEE